eukprot:CAMPEP_0118928376 /NCGR_PEP_ID=MMETSP1169-20130426/5638_1 /TAXON_ID=36882 /ORGANISM="Pyramimonas obovata, Strain CCMP722" /LENGTH=178 /DNA_ID=CAMNT_0006870327 /DNA_START=158 /DNA_END=691 /DNA_ORIENTATION=-
MGATTGSTVGFVSSLEEAASQFRELVGELGVVGDDKVLALKEGDFGRGIFTTCDVPKGSLLISVPLELCLRAEREEAISVPNGSWDQLTQGLVVGWPRLQTFYEEYPLPWEVRFAVCLLDAAEGNASSAFWGKYAALLPAPLDLPVLGSLQARALAALQDPTTADSAAADQARLRQLC